jgi:hypothetical protein
VGVEGSGLGVGVDNVWVGEDIAGGDKEGGSFVDSAHETRVNRLRVMFRKIDRERSLSMLSIVEPGLL